MKTKIDIKSFRKKLRMQIYNNNINPIKYLPKMMQGFFSISPLVHPLEPIMQNPLNYDFEPAEIEFIQQLNESNKFYILEQHQKILEQFFLAKQKENSPLGDLYKELDYSDFLDRLITKKFKAIYSDGRLLVPREHNAEFTLAYQQKFEEFKSARLLLEKIGTAEDNVLYKEYLSLEEGAVSPFIVPQEYFLPFSDGRRLSQSPILNRIDLQGGNLFEEWDNAHAYPVSVSYIAAPEFRNCFSLQYDVLACVRFDALQNESTAYFANRQTSARQQAGFSSVLSLIYGEENALSINPNQAETLAFENPVLGKGVFYVNAYKKRLQHSFQQLLELANFSLMEKGKLTLKGMSLGAFAIQQLTYPMETIFRETLKQTIAELSLSQIQKIDLINFPSVLSKFSDPNDRDYVLSIGSSTKVQEINSKDSIIEIYECFGAPLAAQTDLHVATHFCGDSLSFPGNEAHAGVPSKVSSDDSVMHYAGAGRSMIRDMNASKEQINEKIYLLGENKSTLFVESKIKADLEEQEQALKFRV